MIDAPHQERQRLPEMAENDLEPGIGLEHPAEHEPDRLRRRFDRVAPGGAHDHRKILGIILVVSIHHRGQRNRWMQVDRNVERLRALEDRPEPFVVEKDSIGEAVNHRPLEAELGGALEFVRRRLGIAGRQRREGCKPRRVRGDDGVEAVIDAARDIDRFGAGELLRRGRAMGQDLHVDPRLVHFLEAHVAEIVEAFEHFRIAHAFGADEERRQLLIPVMFLQRDHRTFQRWQHDCVSPFASRTRCPSNRESDCHGCGNSLGRVAAKENRGRFPPMRYASIRVGAWSGSTFW